MGKGGSPRVCSLCQNRSSVTDTQTDDAFERITYHRFPANPQRLDQWLELCGLSKDIIPTLSYKFICSNHFEPECFERDLRAELLYGTKRITLKKDALPTIRVPKQQLKRKLTAADSCEEDDRQKRKVQVDKLLNGEIPVTEEIVNPFRKRACEDSSSREPDKSDMTQSELLQRIEELEQQTMDQRKEITQLQRTIDSKTERINFAKAEMVNAAISLQELKDHANRHVNERITEILSGRFGDGQLATIMAGPPDGSEDTFLQVLWTEAELVQALKLRGISKEAYSFLRHQMHYPLPEDAQIERWIHGAYLETGHNATALRILQIHASTLNDIELICTLNLLHISTPARYRYDSKRDQIIGPNAHLHCLTVQGLFSTWQQIVYIDFDLSVGREMMEKLITDLYHIGCKVVAITTDCDQTTVDVWRTLDVSSEQHYIRHPVTGHSVYVYACPDRTLVAIHRVLVEDGFLMQENNLLVSNATLMPFMVRYSASCGIYERYLSREILQNVACNSTLSREFISFNTTNTLRMLSSVEAEGSDLLSTLTTLFYLFIDWYELCTADACSVDNSAELQLITKLPYGMCEDEQNIVLDGMFDVMETIRCADSDNDFLPQAILMSINSMRKLLADLRATYPGQIGGIPMLRMSTVPMNETLLKLQERLRQDSKTHSVNDILYSLCKTVSCARQSSHATNNLLQLGGFSGEGSLENLRREDDPPDPDVPYVSDQNACSFLTQFAVARLGHKYDYLGERSVTIEQNNGQYAMKATDGDVRPSEVWKEQAKRLESYLRKALNEKKAGLASGLIDFILGRHPRMARDLVELYVRKRIAIKMQSLNSKLDAVSAQTTDS
uniref:THAP-type domain-containing protein n=1 Tax=Anopheles maculatus TaxID=74869 RepID=A0A182SVY3_9DIPT